MCAPGKLGRYTYNLLLVQVLPFPAEAARCAHAAPSLSKDAELQSHCTVSRRRSPFGTTSDRVFACGHHAIDTAAKLAVGLYV